MNITKRLLPIVMIAVMMITSLAGCGTENSSKSPEKVFRFAVSTEPENLDPTLCNGIVDNDIQHAITEGLTRTTGGKISPGIASRWDISADGKVYTFHLRDAKWSDGVPITAHDFVYSWRRLADPAVDSEYSFAIWMVEGGREVNLEGADPKTLGIRAIDDKTLEVTLVNPTAYFLGYIGNQSCFAPLRQDIVEAQGEEFAAGPENNVYSGPFMLESQHDNVWTFRKNPEFWNSGNVALDSGELYYIASAQEQVEMYNNGSIDYAVIPSEEVYHYKSRSDANHYLNGNLDYCYFNTESDNKVLRDREFRLALNYAIDRIDYNHNANNNVFKPYGALIFPGLSGKNRVTYGEAYDVDSYAYPLDGDIDRARYYLDAVMQRLDIGRPDDITIELLVQDSESAAAIADELKRQWEDGLGINVTIHTVSRADQYGKYMPESDYEVAFSGWGADYNDPYTYLELFRTDNTSYTPYSNPDYDELLEKTISEPDQAKRMDMLNEAEQMLISDGAFIPLQCKDIYYLLNPAVSNLTLSYCNITIDWAYAVMSE